MSQWLVWLILSALTGSPILSAVVLLVGWWALDRVTFRFLPSPYRALRKWQRGLFLERHLTVNPHDRRARLELAEWRIERRRYPAAVELLRANLAAGDDDTSTLFAMGVACLGAGHVDQGELFLTEAEKQDPHFRVGQIDLERGRFRLARGDSKGAREALERLRHTRRGTVEGRVLLARALEQAGDDGAGALMRREAWDEFASAPRFQRNAERFWAWRANPSRPATYAVIALVVLALLGLAQARIGDASSRARNDTIGDGE